jgi:ArsR family transcriptional regulator
MSRASHGLSPEQAARLFGALSHAARVRLLLLLAERGEAGAGDLQAALGLSLPRASQQFRLLQRAGLVDSRRDGRRVLYRLASPAAAEVLRLVCGAC